MKTSLVFLLVLMSTGCSTIYDMSGGTPGGPHIYGGIRNLQEYGHSSFSSVSILEPVISLPKSLMDNRDPVVRLFVGIPVGAVIFPSLIVYFITELSLTFVADTVVAPVTGTMELLRPSSDSEKGGQGEHSPKK